MDLSESGQGHLSAARDGILSASIKPAIKSRRITRRPPAAGPEEASRALFIAAMQAAWLVSEEATAVAKAAMDLAILEWVAGQPVPLSLAKDVAESAERMSRAAAMAIAACGDA